MSNEHTYAVIMAGGSGTRFWPASRKSHPKQLLPLGPSALPLVRETIERIAPLVDPSRVLVVTASHLKSAVKDALPELPEANILLEPAARNTAPCVAWAAAEVFARDPEALMMVLPADHHIGNRGAFLRTLTTALDAAKQETPEGHSLVTVGIEPTRPETGFGYLELAEPVAPGLLDSVFTARRFVEKPDRERAEVFLSSGNFVWNSGMFFFRADAICGAFRQHVPDLGTFIDAYLALEDEARSALVERAFAELPSVSIDHGVMEKAALVSVVRGSFGWSDLGSWESAWELAPKDTEQNVLRADATLVDSQGCFVQAPGDKFVALVGVQDLVVVDTGDALLIMPKDRSQDVREVVAALKTGDRQSLL